MGRGATRGIARSVDRAPLRAKITASLILAIRAPFILFRTYIADGLSSCSRALLYPPPKPVEMPRFIVRLVPEAITGKRMDFHISVQNLGADADITEYSFNVPGNFQSDDHNLSDRRRLQKMKWRGPPVKKKPRK